MATVYPYFTLNPVQEQVNVSPGLNAMTCYLSIWSTPTFEFGTRVDWTLDSITIDTDVTINTPYQTSGFGNESIKRFKTDIDPVLEDDSFYYHSYTIAGTQVGTGEPFEFSTGVFNFTTGPVISPYRVKNPGPENGEEDVNRITDLTWEVGEETADNYDVWFGTPGNMVLVGTEIADEIFSIADYLDPDKLDLDTEYEWRIDSYVDNELVATGSVWSYTTRAQRTVVLSSPDDLSENNYTTGLLISWTIDGIGAQYGSEEDQDFLFIYVRKDDANFTEDDLVGNFVQAFVNDDLTISRLDYNTLYYWQVQAGNTAADLADSEVQSFTTMTFRPPAVPTSGGEPIGINNMLTRKRFIAAANNKIWYEDI